MKPCNFHNNISPFVIISHSQHYCALLLIITDCVATVIYTTTGLQTLHQGLLSSSLVASKGHKKPKSFNFFNQSTIHVNVVSPLDSKSSQQKKIGIPS
jgi:hypothetical protein